MKHYLMWCCHSASWSWIKRLTTRSLQKHTTPSVKPSGQIDTTCVCRDTEELGFVFEKLQCGVFSTKWSTTNHFWLWLLQAAHLNHSRRQKKKRITETTSPAAPNELSFKARVVAGFSKWMAFSPQVKNKNQYSKLRVPSAHQTKGLCDIFCHLASPLAPFAHLWVTAKHFLWINWQCQAWFVPCH